jgi:hypothetical protein
VKAAFALIAFLSSALSWATDALILISPDAAGPSSSEHGQWILWPPNEHTGASNRPLSLLTGLDWAGTGNELVFGIRDRRYVSAAFSKLQKKGYFIARQTVVDRPSMAAANPSGVTPAVALLLAMDGRGPQVNPLSLYDRWPKRGIAFAEADGWESVAAIVFKAGGRVLVIEYPPPAGRRWSRFWTRGQGWRSSQLPVWPKWQIPGLIPASQAGNLLLNQKKFDWVPNDSGNWGGAGKWLEFIATAGPLVVASFGFLIAFFAGCAVYLISIEERAHFAGITVKYLALTPAAILLAGRITGSVGVSFATLALLLAFAAVILSSLILGILLRHAFPASHQMLAVAVVGFVAAAASPPLWGAYSNVLVSNVLPVSPEAVGACFAYLTAACAFSRGPDLARWIGRILALIALAWAVSGYAWWVADQWVLATLPILAVLVGEKLFRTWMLAILALLPLADGSVIRHGIVWAPGDLFVKLNHRNSLNLARHAEFFSSYAFLVTLFLSGGIALFVERLFFQEIRRTLRRDSRTQALFEAGAICLAMGIFQPLLLYPALTCFVGGILVLLSDTALSV